MGYLLSVPTLQLWITFIWCVLVLCRYIWLLSFNHDHMRVISGSFNCWRLSCQAKLGPGKFECVGVTARCGSLRGRLHNRYDHCFEVVWCNFRRRCGDIPFLTTIAAGRIRTRARAVDRRLPHSSANPNTVWPIPSLLN